MATGAAAEVVVSFFHSLSPLSLSKLCFWRLAEGVGGGRDLPFLKRADLQKADVREVGGGGFGGSSDLARGRGSPNGQDVPFLERFLICRL